MKCAICRDEIDVTQEPDGYVTKFIHEDGGKSAVHEDCYYDELGKAVEGHPIVGPHRGRGGDVLD